jgi:hypothetical protein
MADDRKRDEQVCSRVTERMFIDINRLAALEERTASDWLYVALRAKLYGEVHKLSTTAVSTSAAGSGE